jgi:hypothetical protein
MDGPTIVGTGDPWSTNSAQVAPQTPAFRMGKLRFEQDGFWIVGQEESGHPQDEPLSKTKQRNDGRRSENERNGLRFGIPHRGGLGLVSTPYVTGLLEGMSFGNKI